MNGVQSKQVNHFILGRLRILHHHNQFIYFYHIMAKATKSTNSVKILTAGDDSEVLSLLHPDTKKSSLSLKTISQAWRSTIIL